MGRIPIEKKRSYRSNNGNASVKFIFFLPNNLTFYLCFIIQDREVIDVNDKILV